MAFDASQQVAAQEAYLAALQSGTRHQAPGTSPLSSAQSLVPGASNDLMRSLVLQQHFDRINQALMTERQAADSAIAHMLPAFLAYPALAQIANDAEGLVQSLINYDQLVNEVRAVGDGYREAAVILDEKLHDPDFLLEHAFAVWGQYTLNDEAKAKISQKFMALIGDEPAPQPVRDISFNAAQLSTIPRLQSVPIPPIPAETPSQSVTKMDLLRSTMNGDDAYAVLNTMKQRR